MSKPPRDRASSASQTYFVTTSAWQNQALFQSKRCADLFLTTLFAYRDQSKFLVHEFVLMPNHAHILLTLCSNVTLERAVQLIKGGFSFRAGKDLGIKREIWQRGYVDHRIRDYQDYMHHREYIRQNPVKAHLVEAPDEYPYNSARKSFQLDPIPQGLKPDPLSPLNGTTEVVPSRLSVH
jgi:putative transposase